MDSVGSSTKENLTSAALWKRAAFFTNNAVAFSQRFHTLRDMVQDIYIEASDIQHIKRLGEGAFASVSLAVINGRMVAVKCLKSSLLTSDRDLNVFMNEAALLKKLSHSAIVGFVGVSIETESQQKSPVLIRKRSLFEVISSRLVMKAPHQAIGESSRKNEEEAVTEMPTTKEDTGSTVVPLKNVMLIQEYMTRGTLKSMLMKQMEHPMRLIYTRREGLEWLIQMAQGLQYLHQAKPKIIHRDLKLENIMLTLSANGKVVAKIGDFGVHAVLKEPKHSYRSDSVDIDNYVRSIASAASASKEDKKATIKACYRLSGRTGSLMYMAPEVLHCQPYNEKADVFSFAMIMYELFSKTILLCLVSCSGEPDEIERYARVIAGGGRPVVPEDWPQEVQSLIRLCWRQQPDDRPSISDLLQKLEAYIHPCIQNCI